MLQPPLILTLRLDEASFQYFNQLRQQHFPASRNYIDAHLTLFHALPAGQNITDVVQAASQLHENFPLAIIDVMSIGKGVAFKMESTKLAQLHKNFQAEWQHFLLPQDKQKLWPHITVQNKVSVQEARMLLAELKRSFTPFSAIATGFQLWEYLDGPWKLIETYVFREMNSE